MVVVTPGILKKELQWDFPSGCSSQLEGLPCLCTGGSGQWLQSLAGMSVLRDGDLIPSESLLFPSSAPRYRLRRSGCACLGLRPCGKCLRLCLQKVPSNRPRSWSWLSSHLFLVERSSDGLASGDRFLSLGSVSLASFMMVTVASALSQSESRLFLLPWT